MFGEYEYRNLGENYETDNRDLIYRLEVESKLNYQKQNFIYGRLFQVAAREIRNYMQEVEQLGYEIKTHFESVKNANEIADSYRNKFQESEKEKEKIKLQRDKAIRTIESIMGNQKHCIICANSECKNSNTSDATCRPKWNGKEL